MEKQVAIITGGAQGIGKNICEALLKIGYRVVIADNDVSTSQQTSEEFAASHGADNILFINCDVRDNAQFAHCFEETLKAFKRVDVLVNNAGILNENEWERTLELNVTGVILGCKNAIKYMGKDNGGNGGDVINIASVLGLMPTPSVPVYCASKHAVVGLTRAWGDQLYLDKHGIRFNCVCPSHVNTMLQHRWRTELGVTPWPALMEPEYVAAAIPKVLEDKRNGASMLVSIVGGYQYIGLPDIIHTFSLD